ncbi:MAG TPA: hypothetical protein VIY69_01535 [Candidatus Acidoferrales bacterium]
MAVHTKRERRPKSVSGKSNSSSATNKRRAKRQNSSRAPKERARKELKQAQLLGKQLNDQKVDLIKIDLQTSFTFAKIAKGATDDREKRLRNRHHARRGYDAVTHFLETAKLGRSERDAIEQGIGRLKAELKELGESFDRRHET